jgi:hypothetical protein
MSKGAETNNSKLKEAIAKAQPSAKAFQTFFSLAGQARSETYRPLT